MNDKIIEEFKRLVNYLQLLMENEKDPKEKIKFKFRIESIKKGLKIISKYNNEIRSGDELAEIEGIGKGIISRIDEILEKGKLSEIKSNKKVMEELNLLEELTDIIGIGPKIAKKLIKQYKLKSVDDLIKRNKTGEIILNDKLLLGLKYYGVYEKNIPRKEIDNIYKYFIKLINKNHPEYIITFCGSYRRGRPTSNDIDVLITSKTVTKQKDLKVVVDILRDDKFLLDDLTNGSPSTKYMGFCRYNNNPVRRIDIRYMAYESYYTALLYFTGSDDFNRKMRQIAKKKNYKLNEYGLYKLEIKGGKLIEKQITIESEEEVFKILGMQYKNPGDRNI
jgi:DNA polymerase/3'-5' exonuclease PolX